MTKQGFMLPVGAPILLHFLLLLASAAHRFQFNGGTYRTSPLIKIEFLLLTVVIVTILIQFLLAVFFLATRNWPRLLLTGFVLVLGIVLLVVSISIDAPTLLYLT